MWFDSTKPIFRSRCANSTERPEFEWGQIFHHDSSFEETVYTCNKPLYASQSASECIIEMIQYDYVLPLNITIPPITTTARSSTPSKITPKPTFTSSTSTLASTSAKIEAGFVHLNQIEKIIFGLLSLFLIVRL
ncbi:unnamed protein product [Rotaria magnacalcarata]|uniref:Uncharacterized protein n=1 Tax=Rotaria magnacalcarata TaxID=392030 RepID=A0A816UGK4_9BILA|nr:unnamed protein product [Rotaria magnacalcarata]CAF4010741.1 unnamed protein product [Rotaria magnacalcarata]